MAAYYSGPRVRLPSNRSLELSDVSGSSPPPATRDKDKESYGRDAYTHSHSPVLIFPTAPSSEPASPHPRVARLRHLRVDSTASASSSRVVSTRVRVDSNATSDLSSPIRVGSDLSSSVRVGSDFSSPIRVHSDISLARLDSDRSIRTRVDSNASSLLVSPSLIEVPSPRFSLTSASGWDLSPTGSAPLTRERIVRLGSARVIPSWSSGSGSAEVEMWEWTSDGGSWQARRGDENETQYEDALSQFHFPTLEESRWACHGGAVEKGGLGLVDHLGVAAKGGLGLVERNGIKGGFGQGDGGLGVAHPALGEQQQRTVRLPFRFILETVLGIDPATLNLLERGTHEPESISETALFGTATDAGITNDEIEAIERSERIVWPSFSLLCVWAGLGMPKWRVGQR
ncbi:unnamed protein product [Rhizoctonia solani]|uniref:Uncharacterized protein n=2 Tax=Rhizoctonia solani TaxID=456999 RepID=A0A8H3DCX4_9AGAM